MATYNFTREVVSGKYNINNQFCVDGESNPYPLFKEIKSESTLPDNFSMKCSGVDCIIEFSVSLDSTQQTTLNDIVTAHKAHTGA